MWRRILGSCVLVAALTGVLGGQVTTAVRGDEPLLAGVAETDITPPNGFPIAGYYHERLAEGTLDPLKAKALVLKQGDVQAAIVVCDLTAISRDLCLAVRKQASQLTSIPPEHIAVAATHSHTAPDYGKSLYEYLELTDKPEPNSRPAYAQQLVQRIAQAIAQAHQNLAHAELRTASALQSVPIAFNRRFVMRDGSVQTWRNLKDPQVVRAAGPIDPEVSTVALYTRHDQGDLQLRGVMSNFALHLDTLGGMRWSADYPYYVEQALRKHLDHPQLVSIFGNGCCGDINHSDPTRSERNKTDFIGQALANTIQVALAEQQPLNSHQLQVRSSIVHLPLQEVSPAELERSLQLLAAIKQGSKVEFLDHVTAYKTLMLAHYRGMDSSPTSSQYLSWGLSHAWRGVGDSLPVDVQAITIGDELAMVFLPGEVFVDLGLAIKRGSRFRNTMVVELSNCVETAYIPTHAATAGGSYEVTNSTLKPGGGEMLVSAALQLLKQ